MEAQEAFNWLTAAVEAAMTQPMHGADIGVIAQRNSGMLNALEVARKALFAKRDPSEHPMRPTIADKAE